MYRRKLKLKANFKSGSSHLGFKRGLVKLSMCSALGSMSIKQNKMLTQGGVNRGQSGVGLHRHALSVLSSSCSGRLSCLMPRCTGAS